MHKHFRSDAIAATFTAAFVMAASMGVFSTMATEVQAAISIRGAGTQTQFQPAIFRAKSTPQKTRPTSAAKPDTVRGR